MAKIPLLRDILPGPEPRPPMTLSLLARELNVPVSRLLPLIEEGYLKQVDDNTVETPPPAGLLWLRGWFAPMQAKPMFTAQDVADLLDVDVRTVPSLAAAHDVPVVHDPAFGLCFSMWSTSRLLKEVLSEGNGARFDRQALLWFLVGGNPSKRPDFSEQLEAEIERVAHLPEPARSLRREALLAQWRDAKLLAGVSNDDIERAFKRLA